MGLRLLDWMPLLMIRRRGSTSRLAGVAMGEILRDDRSEAGGGGERERLRSRRGGEAGVCRSGEGSQKETRRLDPCHFSPPSSLQNSVFWLLDRRGGRSSVEDVTIDKYPSRGEYMASAGGCTKAPRQSSRAESESVCRRHCRRRSRESRVIIDDTIPGELSAT